MTTQTPTSPSRGADPNVGDELSVAAEPLENHGKAGDTPFAGEAELKVLVAWLEQEPSDADGWHILNALTRRTLQRIDMAESTRCFTTEELCDWAQVTATSNLWKSVKTWWEARRRKIRHAMRYAGVEYEPLLDRRGGGGRGNKAVNSLRRIPLSETGSEDSLQETETSDDDTVTNARATPLAKETVYWGSTNSPVKLSGVLLRTLFSAGEIRIGSARHNI